MIRKFTRRTVLTRTAQVGSLAAIMSGPWSAARVLAQAEDEVGRHLIGDLEGPEVVTDRALWPTSFAEAPELAARVANGELPPVAERIGSDPLVIRPVHEIGRYGGTWRRGFTGPGDRWNGWRSTSGPDSLLFWDFTGREVVPNIAKGWSVSEDGHETILHLREGMRWSDGEPFTADDFLFWYEHVYGNGAIVPQPSPFLIAGGRPGRLRKLDAHNVLLSFEAPYFLLPRVLATHSELDGYARRGRDGLGLYVAAHYARQFLPEFVGEERADLVAAEAGFDNWVLYYFARSDWALNPELPVVSPWKVTSPISSPSWEFERNPYSIWMDTEGNQLPYIDRMVYSLAENLELLNLRTIAGEYDWQERHVDIAKLPVLVSSQEAQGYKAYLDPHGGSDLMLIVNHSFDRDPEIAKWLQNVDFRRALSLGIDRDEINEIFFMGLGQPRTIVPADDNIFHPGPEYSRKWAELDVDAANRLLDEVGLSEKDADGFRLRTDGGGRVVLELSSFAGQLLPFGQMSEVIRQHWREIGIDSTVNEMERSLAESRARNNDLQILTFSSDGGHDDISNLPIILPLGNPAYTGPRWGEWLRSGGESGVEPAPFMRDAYERFTSAFSVPPEEQVKLGREIWAILVDNVSIVGVIGLSPAYQGVRVVTNRMGNVPSRQYNSPIAKTSAVSRTMTVYFKT